jgi:hypothetical protein
MRGAHSRGTGKHWEQNGRQYRYNGDNDKQFDERKAFRTLIAFCAA